VTEGGRNKSEDSRYPSRESKSAHPAYSSERCVTPAYSVMSENRNRRPKSGNEIDNRLHKDIYIYIYIYISVESAFEKVITSARFKQQNTILGRRFADAC
jgi:hypothetical protein